MFSTDVWSEIESELSQAANSRAAGFEGRARVQARRAAGIASRAYLENKGIAAPRSALDALHSLRAETSLPPERMQGLEYLLMRVDADFELPPGIDLVIEARLLALYLNQAP